MVGTVVLQSLEPDEDLISNMYIRYSQVSLSRGDAVPGVVCPGASFAGDAEVPH